MSQYQQPPSGNPFGPQQGGMPPQQPFGPPGGFPPPVPVRQGNPGLAILVAVIAMLVGAGIYGAIIKASDTQIGYLAIGLGALIGASLGKLGGRNPVLPFVGVVLGLLGVYLGQLFGGALIIADQAGTPGVFELLTDYFDVLNRALKDSLEAIDYLFYVLGGAAGFSVTRKFSA